MNDITCPHCNAGLPARDIAAGWCDTCGKKIPSYVFSSAPGKPPAERSAPARVEPVSVLSKGPTGNQCSLCASEEAIEPCWLRIIRVWYWVFGGSAQTMYVQCQCCRGCREKISSLKWFRRACLMVMFAIFPLGCLVYLPFGAVKREVATPLQAALALGILIGIFAIFFAMPVLMAFGGKRRMRKILSKEGDERLRRVTGVRRWGLSNFGIVKGAGKNGPQLKM
jgi:hypothetical protein